jgi:hypothetical protein
MALLRATKENTMRPRKPYLSRPSVLALLALSACTTPDKVALKDYAPKSADADIQAVSLSASDDDTFDPSRVGTEFPDTTKQVAVWYRWSGADSGKKIGIRWSKGSDVVLEQIDTLLKTSGASAYVLKMGAGSPLPVGAYDVALLEDGIAVTKIPFKVGTDRSEGSEVAVVPADTSAEEQSQVAVTDSAPAAEAPAGEPPAQADTAPPQPISAPSSPAQTVLASHETKWPGVVVEVTELVRKGNALNAKLRFTNKGTKEVKPDFYYRDTYALDENNTKYEVLKDDKGAYLGSHGSGYNYWWGEQIEPGASRTVWMRFALPPADVKAVTLQVGTMEPFEDVQIQN